MASAIDSRFNFYPSYWLFFVFFFLDYPMSSSCATLVYVNPCEGIKDSHGFWNPRHGFWIPITGFQIFQWTCIPCRFQLSVRCRIPTAVFRIGRPRIPDSTSKKFPKFRIPRAKIPGFLYMWRIYASNQFGTCILIPSTMLYFEYWIVHHYLSHWMNANYTS